MCRLSVMSCGETSKVHFTIRRTSNPNAFFHHEKGDNKEGPSLDQCTKRSAQIIQYEEYELVCEKQIDSQSEPIRTRRRLIHSCEVPISIIAEIAPYL
jgi:hypothetical protein